MNNIIQLVAQKVESEIEENLKKVIEGDIQAFRNEMLEADSSMDGTGPLKRMNNIKEWLEFNQKCENEQTVPENRVTCEQYIYVCSR